MKIGVMSDSHDLLDNIRESVRIFKERGVQYVLHLGDYVSPNAVLACRGVKLIGIFGNNDGDKYRLVRAFNAIGGEIKGEFHEFEEDGLTFACYHGTELPIKDALVECGRYDVVVFGHTHEAVHEKSGNTIVLNPGTAHGFGNKASVLIFDTETKESERVEF